MQISPIVRIAASDSLTETPAEGRAALEQAAAGFESLFIAQVLKGARASLPGNDLFGGTGLTAAEDMLDGEMARLGGSGARLGIAEAILRQFAPPSSDPAGKNAAGDA